MRPITLWLLCTSLVGCAPRGTYATKGQPVSVATDVASQSEWRHWTAWVLAGSSIDPPGQEGLAHLTAKLIETAGTRSAPTHEARWTATVGHDWTALGLRCPTSAASACQTHFLRTLAQPELSDVDVLDAKRASQASQPDHSDPDALLRELVFEGHGYGHSSAGRAASLSSIDLADIESFHTRQYTRATMLFGADAGGETFGDQIAEVVPSRNAVPPHELSHFLPIRHTQMPVLVIETPGLALRLRAARVEVGAPPEAQLPERWHLSSHEISYSGEASLLEALEAWRSRTAMTSETSDTSPPPSLSTPPGLRTALLEQHRAMHRPQVLHPANDAPWPWVFVLSGDKDVIHPMTEALLSSTEESGGDYVVYPWRMDGPSETR